MKNKNILKFSVIAIVFAMIISSCKKTYNDPPEPTDPVGLVANTTIKELKAKHTVAGAFDIIDSNLIISGVVIANDKSGNFYKEMYIRDETGAIALELASGGLYVNYPVGRRVFVKCKGMCISDYHNMIQLGIKSIANGLVSLEGIPAPIITNYVVGGGLGNDAKPKLKTQADLNTPSGVPTMQNPLLGDLIKLDGYEFLAGDTKRSYADTSYYHSTLGGQIHVKSCSNPATLIVMTSGYADFASKAPQAGNGDITAIYTVYNTDKQLIIRDTTDVNFAGPRCYMFEEDFNAYTTTTSCWNFPGWQNIKESGDVCFTLAAFGGSSFPKVSAFTSAALSTTNIVSWLISPAVALPAGISPKYSYTCAHRYTVGTLKALISTDYDGTSQTPSTATWTELNSIQANSASFTPFIPYGPFDLSAYAGKKVYLAFKHEVPAGTSKNAAATFEPDDMKISKN